MHADRLARPRTLLVLLLALVASLGALAPGAPASATSYSGAVSGNWPTTWTAYTYANGTVVGDTNSDQTPPYMDLVSGTCSSCVGTQPSVLFANDGTSAFFRMRMAVDNNDAGKGGLFGGAFLVQIADASNTVRAVVGVDGKQSGADNVYVTNAVGGTTQIVYEYPFTGTSAGMRWIPVGDGTGQYFLDFQVPVSVVSTISGGAITPTTPIKLYYGSSAAANLATINKDLMIPGASAVDFTTLAVRKLIPPTYAVSFDSAGGTAVSGQTVTDGDPVVQPTAPTRSGHVFAGWYDGSTPWSFSTAVTGPLTLTAHWTRPTHTVSFDSAGGSAVASQSVEEDSAATAPTAPTRTGWTFTGWYDGATTYDFTTPVTGPVALTAHWTRTTYAVTFDSNGGTTVTAQTIDHGDHATEPTAPTRTGWTFTGWYAGASPYAFATPVTGPVTLTAHWARVAHMVSFESAGGSAVASQSVEEDSAATAPTAPTRTGWTFTGWYDGASPYAFATPVTGPVALTAHWTRTTYAVTFDTNGGSTVTAQTIDHGDNATEPTAPTRTGWTFTGWYDGATAYDFTTPVTGTTNLTAQWTRTTYAVTFDSNGGSTVAAQAVDHGDNATTPTAPTRTGWTFAAWYDGAAPYDFADAVTGPVALTAHWTRVSHPVAFDSGGGTAVAGQSVAEGGTATEPTAPTRTGWTFAGWFAGAAPYDFTTPVTGTTNLTAHWTRSTYAVTFDSDGGSAVAGQTVDHGDQATPPAPPTRTGWTFAGWFAGAAPYDFTTPVTGTTNLIAHWTRNSYVVTFDTEGGGTIPDLVVDEHGVAAQPADPVRPGFVFVGWYDGSTAWDFDHPITAATQLSARWAPAFSAVSYDAAGGSAVPDETVAYGGAATEPPAPTRTGWTFAGWYDGATPYDFSGPVTGPVALVAHWTRTTYVVTFDSAGGSAVAPQTVDHGDPATEPVPPTRAGHTFGGWTRAGAAWSFATPVVGAITLRARWTPVGVTPDPDTDRDGLSDAQEAVIGTDPDLPDTDRDGVRDGAEVSGSRNTFGHCGTDPLRADTDRDGLADGAEVRGGRLRGRIVLRYDRAVRVGLRRTDPCRADTDRDGLDDGRELRGTRVRGTTYRSDPLRRDTDRDGLTDRQEVRGVDSGRYRDRVTDPMDWDTDDGGVSDGFEVRSGSDPLDIGSSPGHPRIVARLGW